MTTTTQASNSGRGAGSAAGGEYMQVPPAEISTGGHGQGSAGAESDADDSQYSVTASHDSSDSTSREIHRKSSVAEAAVNLTKLCIGSGVLALPYAVEKGGLILSPIFLAVIAWWNFVSCGQMMACKHASRDTQVPASIASTYSKIAYCGSGMLGVRVTDACVIITLLGVCVTFLITFSTLLRSIPIPGVELGPLSMAIISSVVVFPVCCSKDVSRLVHVSFLGLLCLLLGIAVIAVYGVGLYGHAASVHSGTIPLWADNASDFATFIGIATFGYGTCSLAFPVEESMAMPSQFSVAAKWSLSFVWLVYAIVGNGLATLFVWAPTGISSNILRNLPVDGWTSHTVKLSMCCVCLLTFPLTFIPSAQMLEQYFSKDRDVNAVLNRCTASLHSLCGSIASCLCCVTAGGGGASGGASPDERRHIASAASERSHGSLLDREPSSMSGIELPTIGQSKNAAAAGGAMRSHNHGYEAIAGGESPDRYAETELSNGMHGAADADGGSSGDDDACCSFRWIFRGFVLIALQFISINVPCFGLVVSLLGCFTVSILSYVLPPLFSLQIITGPEYEQAQKQQRLEDDRRVFRYYRDVFLVVVGTCTTLVATVIVGQQGLADISTDTC